MIMRSIYEWNPAACPAIVHYSANARFLDRIVYGSSGLEYEQGVA